MAGGSQAGGWSAQTITVLPPYRARWWPQEGNGTNESSCCLSTPKCPEGHRFSTTSGPSWDLASAPAVLNPGIQLPGAKKWVSPRKARWVLSFCSSCHWDHPRSCCPLIPIMCSYRVSEARIPILTSYTFLHRGMFAPGWEGLVLVGHSVSTSAVKPWATPRSYNAYKPVVALGWLICLRKRRERKTMGCPQ